MGIFDSLFKNILGLSAVIFVLLLIGVFLTLLIQSLPSIEVFGINFYTNSVWDPVANQFGSLPFLVGTVITSFLALIRLISTS